MQQLQYVLENGNANFKSILFKRFEKNDYGRINALVDIWWLFLALVKTKIKVISL